MKTAALRAAETPTPSQLNGKPHAEVPKKLGKPAESAITKNPYEAFTLLARDSQLVANEIKNFLGANNRHGAAEVINSALLRMLDNVAVIRAVEEEL